MLVVFLLDVLAMREVMLVAGLAVAEALLLSMKSRVHRFVQRVLTEQEPHDAPLLAAAAAIVLPLLPDRVIDPWPVPNLRKLRLFAVIVMGISAVGHVALRAFGARTSLLTRMGSRTGARPASPVVSLRLPAGSSVRCHTTAEQTRARQDPGSALPPWIRSSSIMVTRTVCLPCGSSFARPLTPESCRNCAAPRIGNEGWLIEGGGGASLSNQGVGNPATPNDAV